MASSQSAHGRKLRFGVVGAGGFAEVCHVPGLQKHPQAEVVALCGRNEANCRAMADRLGIPDIHTDYHDLVDRADIDAVTVATPDALHEAVAMAALKAGKHVFCEKPLTKTVEQAREVTSVARQSGLVHMVAFTFRYNRSLERLKEMLKQGAIGQPTYISCEVHWPSAMNPNGTSAWRNYAEDSAAGILGDMGIHFFDTIQYILSPVTSLSALLAVLPRTARDQKTGEQRTTDAIDLTSCLLRTAYEAPTVPPVVQGHMITSWMTPPRGHNGNLHVVGTEGAFNATLGRGQREQLERFKPGKGWEPVALPEDATTDQTTALGRMMGSFVDAILRGSVDASHDATFLDGLRTQLAMDAAIRSAQSGRWEDVPAE